MLAEELRTFEAALSHRYRFVREAGRGGWGVVYLADDLETGGRVAVKILRPEVGFASAHDRFLREIDIIRHLDHPNIIPIIDSGDCAGTLYYAMPFIEGANLQQRIAQEGQLPLPEALRIASEVARALEHAHRAGVVHRDVKPANILLEHGKTLVADFGIARAIRQSGPPQWVSSANLQMGTPEYMSIEQAGGDMLDGRSDIYSLGCVLYEMLVGSPPFTAATSAGIMARHALDPVPPLTSLRPSLPRAVEEVTLKALAKVPADRFATAGEMAAAIEAAAAAPVRPRDRHRKASRSVVRRVAAAAAVIVVAGASWPLVSPRVKSIVAEREVARGLRSAKAWDLRTAYDHFARAASANPALALPAVWSTQLDAVRDPYSDAPAWISRAGELERLLPSLGGRDSMLALSLVHIARREYPAAVATATALIARDSADAVAWVDLAIGLGRDRAVLRDSASSTGWRFRSSFSSAYDALMRAVRLDSRIMPWLPVSQLAEKAKYRPANARSGRAEPPDTGTFYALPSVEHDSAVLVPVPKREFMGGAIPSSVARALEINRGRVTADLTDWIRRDSTSSDAFAILSELLELNGTLSGPTPSTSAVLALERALSLATVDARKAELRVAHVRLLLKLDRFSEVRVEAKQILRDVANTPGSSWLLAGVSALIGDPDATADLEYQRSRAPGSGSPAANDPAGVARAYARFHSYATTGDCSPKTVQLLDSLIDAIDHAVAPNDRNAAVARLVSGDAAFAAPCIGAERAARVANEATPLGRMIVALARGNQSGLARELALVRHSRSGARPADVTPDHAFLEAWLLLQRGDSAGAVQAIDAQVLSLASLTPSLFEETSMAGSIGRAMLMRVRLSTHDDVQRRKWAVAAEALLGNSDVPNRGIQR